MKTHISISYRFSACMDNLHDSIGLFPKSSQNFFLGNNTISIFLRYPYPHDRSAFFSYRKRDGTAAHHGKPITNVIYGNMGRPVVIGGMIGFVKARTVIDYDDLTSVICFVGLYRYIQRIKLRINTVFDGVFNDGQCGRICNTLILACALAFSSRSLTYCSIWSVIMKMSIKNVETDVPITMSKRP